jgi:hypothetical protein
MPVHLFRNRLDKGGILPFGRKHSIVAYLQAARQLGADGVESAVDAACQCSHTGRCAEGDESDDESILNQILTFFTVLQVLELDIELEKQVIHSKILHSANSQPQPGHLPYCKRRANVDRIQFAT